MTSPAGTIVSTGAGGATGARPGTPDDAVAGVVPRDVATPQSAQEVVELLRGTRGTVVPVGSGSKLGWAAPPTSCDLVLRTTGLDRVVEHVPGDLVVTAEAGVPLATLQAQLAEHGQMLALDPPEPGATLGGLVSANASGPRRLRYGTVRDLLIGVRVVLADGTSARAGGKVVKNVAGYDLGKLYTGAHGTLGVVVETTWRLHPLPAASGAVVVPVPDAAEAGRLALALVRSTLTPSASELRWHDGAGELAVLFESIPASVDAQSDAAVALLGGTRAQQVPGWFGARPEGPLVLRLAYAPSALPHVLRALPADATATASTGVGVAYAAVPEGTDLAALRRALAPDDGTAVVIRGSSTDPWGPVPDSFDLMSRVKDRFDPGRRLSPGRFLGGL